MQNARCKNVKKIHLQYSIQATSDLNPTLSTLDPEILNSLGRLASYQRELQSIRDPLSELLSAVGQGSDGSTLMASVLGFDISSPNAVNVRNMLTYLSLVPYKNAVSLKPLAQNWETAVLLF